jgi:PAS domain S-box-containing protein
MMATINKRRSIHYAITIVGVLIFASIVPFIPMHGSRFFYEHLSIISSMISIFTGLLSLVHYYARKKSLYLWVGVSLLGNGLLEIIFAYAFSFFLAPSQLSNFITWSWLLNRLYFSVTLFAAYISCRKYNPTAKDIYAYLFGGLMLIACCSVLLIDLPAVSTRSFLARFLDLISASFFILCLLGFYKDFGQRSSPFPHWIILSLIICGGKQLLIMPFSREIYDSRFIAAFFLRIFSHCLVAFGLISDMFRLYLRANKESGRLIGLQLAVDQVKEYALIMLSPAGNIISWNEGAKHILGYTEEEIYGKNLSIFYEQEDRDAGRPQQVLSDAIKTGHAVDEGWRLRKEGSRFWTSCIITPVYNTNKTLLGFSKILRNLTEQKIVEEDLRKQNVLLAHLNEQLEQFAYIATHDLKEPLRTITNFTQLLIRNCRKNDQQSEKFADFIEKAVERTRKLIDDLRIYSLIDFNKQREATADLNECLQDSLHLLKKKIEDSKTVISYAKMPSVRGSTSQLMYLFMHIIDNAIKYAKPGQTPIISVECKDLKKEYVISIRDNGIGISKQYQNKLFSIFKKLDNREKTDGTGIGLSICRKVVALHGGRIWCNSNRDGSIFYFSLPVIL